MLHPVVIHIALAAQPHPIAFKANEATNMGLARKEHPSMAGRARMLLMVVVAAFLLGLTACGSGTTGRAGAHSAAASDGSSAEYSSPFYWAAFVLMGEYQ